MKVFEKIMDRLENSKTPFIYYIDTFIFACVLRIFGEAFSDATKIELMRCLHYCLFFSCLVLGIIVLFHFATKTSIDKIARVVLPLTIIIILPPVIDLIVTLGKGYNVSYMFPGLHENMIHRFFTFFGSWDKPGISPGIRIETGGCYCG